MTYFIVIAVLVVLILLSSIRIIEQNTVAVIEFLGKYRRTMSAGFNLKIPILERVALKASLRQQNFALEGNYASQDKVIVTIATNLIYAVSLSLEGVKKYTYALDNRNQSIAAAVENSLRTYIAKETHEGILEKKEELAVHIKADLEKQFEEWGMVIASFQITNVTFPASITNAMSEVVASQQLRKAAENKGEAMKVQAIKEAEAEKERKRLQGEGIALEREAIAKGFKESIDILSKSTGQKSQDIMAMLTLTQYLDTLKNIGMSNNAKVIFVDSNLGKTSDMVQQLASALEAKS
ncbi:MAG: Band 7 protein [Candidatus Parcubacteria bacterium]|jgi:regulator of protease activity HflC (stomatin/prohibitin superfamily)